MAGKAVVLQVISEGVGGGAKHVYDLVSRLRDEFLFIVACPDNGPYFRLFQNLGVIVWNLPLTATSARSLWTLLRVMKKRKVRLLHAHGRKAGWHGRFASMLAHLPVVYSFHGLHYHKHGAFLRVLYVGIERTLSRYTDCSINVSPSERQECLALGFLKRGKSVVIPNGIDWREIDTLAVDVPQMKADLGFAPDDLIVGHVAKFDVQKAQDVLVAAIPAVLHRCPRARLLLVGDGTQRPEIERQVAVLGVDKQVVFCGFRHDVMALLKMVDVFALPSRWEGLSLALLEAMACRKPVVASRVTGNVDVIVDGVTGFLVPVDTPQALAEKIVLLLQNARLRDTFGEQGQQRVKDEFSVDSMVTQTAAVYRDLLSRTPLTV